jgi:hypothetical protein
MTLDLILFVCSDGENDEGTIVPAEGVATEIAGPALEMSLFDEKDLAILANS